MEEQVLSELSMTKTSLEEGVKHLTDWLSKQPHLPNITDEKFLKGFIVGCKSVERAKSRLEKYFIYRTKYPNFFSNRDPANIEWNRTVKFVFLPGTTSEGWTVSFSSFVMTREEVTEFDMKEHIKAIFMILDHQLRQEPVVAGHCFIVDCKGVNSKLIVKCTPAIIASSVNIYQKAWPGRLKAMVWINAPTLTVTFFNTVVKFLFSKKLRERIHVYTRNEEVMPDSIPREMLPQEYGGQAPTLHQIWEETKAALETERDWFMSDGSVGSDESKKPKSTENPRKLKALFSKLDID